MIWVLSSPIYAYHLPSTFQETTHKSRRKKKKKNDMGPTLTHPYMCTTFLAHSRKPHTNHAVAAGKKKQKMIWVLSSPIYVYHLPSTFRETTHKSRRKKKKKKIWVLSSPIYQTSSRRTAHVPDSDPREFGLNSKKQAFSLAPFF
jgi:hypothetical protein